jgi:hypothetical protein
MNGQEIYLNKPGLSRGSSTEAVLVDGKQRIAAVLAFTDGEIPVFGKYRYADIEGFPRIDPAYAGFIFAINELKTRAEVLRWYLEMNTGGTVHTADELNRVRALLSEEETTHA